MSFMYSLIWSSPESRTLEGAWVRGFVKQTQTQYPVPTIQGRESVLFQIAPIHGTGDPVGFNQLPSALGSQCPRCRKMAHRVDAQLESYPL